MPNGRRWFTALLLFVAVSVAGLGIRPLIVPDEPRYGIIPAEMVETGNWLALRMNGFVYYEKPPLGYWMTAASISVFGQNAFVLHRHVIAAEADHAGSEGAVRSIEGRGLENFVSHVGLQSRVPGRKAPPSSRPRCPEA